MTTMHRQMAARPFAALVVAGAALLALLPSTAYAPHASATPTGSSGFCCDVGGRWDQRAGRAAHRASRASFLLQQAGKVRIVQHGRLMKGSALSIDATQIVEHNNSAGLLSIAFPPDFTTATVQHVLLLYTHEPMTGFPYRHNVVSRWTISGNTIDPASEQILVHLDALTDRAGVFQTSHYGGDMEFGADGKLYVGTGDLYQATNGQSLGTLHGKILRYNPMAAFRPGTPTSGSLRAVCKRSGRSGCATRSGLRLTSATAGY